ncbi:hypothetical protein I547_5737 [Mycobacterium kansasii 824]|nr:hypothetical protein I547_5737 [Mycobacterium kansasii 824]
MASSLRQVQGREVATDPNNARRPPDRTPAGGSGKTWRYARNTPADEVITSRRPGRGCSAF